MNPCPDTGIGARVELIESQILRLASMNSMIHDERIIAMLLTSLVNRPKYAVMMGSINNLKDLDTTWNYITMLPIADLKRLRKREQHRVANELLDHRLLAS